MNARTLLCLAVLSATAASCGLEVVFEGDPIAGTDADTRVGSKPAT